MKTYEEHQRELWERFEEIKSEELWILRDSFSVLEYFAQLASNENDVEAANVFNKYLEIAKQTLIKKKEIYGDQTEKLNQFMAERNIDISEWE